MRVLIVDDDQDIGWCMKRLLSRLGHDATSCSSAESALAAVEWLEPDLILLDLEMPQLGGYQLATLLRKKGLTCTPIVAVSSLDDDPKKRSAARIDAHFVKPIRMEQLKFLLESARK